MSTTASADAAPSEKSGQIHIVSHEPNVIESNHNLPARTMAEGDHIERQAALKEDPATMAASEELKHTSISDKTTAEEEAAAAQLVHSEDKDMKETAKDTTPEVEPSDAQDEEMRERISSPKKKRGRDQDEDTRDLEDSNVDGPGSSVEGGAVNGSRTKRFGPEKKRPRDTSEDYTKSADESTDMKVTTSTASTDTSKPSSADGETSRKVSDSSQKATFGGGFNDKPQTSSSAFASSGFASLAASGTSGFGSLGASKPSIFGGGSQSSISGFGALASGKPSSIASSVPLSSITTSSKDKPTPSLSFGGGTTSGFGGLGTGSVFGASLSNGFAGGSGPKLSSFAAPGKESAQLGSKPTKAFGAPESDEDEGSDDDSSEGAAGTDDEESGHANHDEKKKVTKIAKVPIEDGESGETTLLQLRAKLFALDSKEAGWKERGVGTLKINVPTPCAGFDENGVPVPGSFDASGLEDLDEDSNAPRVPRLIMRQENTHRVILNTIIVRAMEFNDKPSTNTAQILFTGFEGEKPTNMLLKLSEANAKLFRSEIQSIQHEL
ncbi:hypothetical protein BGZ60DRAFT_456620 [Tricladium varicosporioides]|nr:hypothetical protein BGZ60DRAFT_456620 [Hymenoscyphus varicosporioides]